MSLPVVEVGEHTVAFSLHACRRWRVRRRPQLRFAQAAAELETEVSRIGRLERRRPHGVEQRGLHHMLETVAWLTLESEAVAFPVVIDPGGRLVATTCLVRSP